MAKLPVSEYIYSTCRVPAEYPIDQEVFVSITYTIGAVDDKLALAQDIARGYQITLAEDGCAEVTSPEGLVYFIYDFECDCPDKLYRSGVYEGQCKHEVWVSQMTPCDVCEHIMYVGAFHSSFGEVHRRFECRTCGHMCDFETVEQERQMRRDLVVEVA